MKKKSRMLMEWKLEHLVNLENETISYHRGTVGKTKVRMKMTTPMSESSGFGEPIKIFYIGNEKKEYATKEELIAAVNERRGKDK